MPNYDRRCQSCGREQRDLLEKIDTPSPACACGGLLERVWMKGAQPSAHSDSIPGGMMIKHGICNPDGTPKRYDSYSEMRRAAKMRGLTNVVRHLGAPGSDKSKHTVSWIGAPVQTDEERRAAWWADEEAHGTAQQVKEAMSQRKSVYLAENPLHTKIREAIAHLPR